MSYFLYSGIVQAGQLFQIKGEEAGHITQSRRVQVGEIIQIQDTKDLRYEARVEKLGNRKLTLNPLQQIETPPDSPLNIHLWQALVKEKALDTIIQKCTELGVASIRLFQSRYSQRLPAKVEIGKKAQRWHRIAVEACKQSGRATPPEIVFDPELLKFNQVSKESSTETIPMICLESSEAAIPFDKVRVPHGEVILIIGPEGGWGPEDLAELPIQKVSLGPRTLRSDTAAIAAVGVMQFLCGDLNGSVE